MSVRQLNKKIKKKKKETQTPLCMQLKQLQKQECFIRSSNIWHILDCLFATVMLPT